MLTKAIGAGIAAICLAAGFAPRLEAQSMSTLTHAKRAASNAVAATNEHTAREQMLDDGKSAPAVKPAAAKPAAAPAKSADASRAKTSRAASAAAKPASGTAAAKPATGASSRTAASKSSAPKSSADTSAASTAKPGGAAEKAPANEITLMRESFTYRPEGRRDPFVSLIASGELRPMISDLRLVTVIYAPQGKSVAIMRDVSTKEQYRVRTGQTLGRMRVASISPKSVTFTIEEYGFSRQEVLALNDTTRARSQ